jgi:hypothetical protein
MCLEPALALEITKISLGNLTKTANIHDYGSTVNLFCPDFLPLGQFVESD